MPFKWIGQVLVTPADVDDGRTLERVLRSDNTGARVLADRGYDSAANRRVLEGRGQRDGIARRAKLGQVKRERLAGRNRIINRVRVRPFMARHEPRRITWLEAADVGGDRLWRLDRLAVQPARRGSATSA